jgi:hypothetical protein
MIRDIPARAATEIFRRRPRIAESVAAFRRRMLFVGKSARHRPRMFADESDYTVAVELPAQA